MNSMTLAFTHKSWLGALSLAYDAGIENVHAWSRRACLCGEWTVAYEVKACPPTSGAGAAPSAFCRPLLA